MSDNTSAAAGSSSTAAATPANTPGVSHEATAEVVRALGNILKSQTGERLTNEKISSILLANMTTLVQQGKLTQSQILQLKEFADNHRSNAATPMSSTAATAAANTPKAAASAPSPAASTSLQSTTAATAKPSSTETGTAYATLASAGELYPTFNHALATTNPGPVQWPQSRPTLTGGVVGGRLSGTPAQVMRSPDDPAILTADDGRSRRKNTPGDQSMRRTIQDLVASVDPNVKMEPEVEDLLLSIADEFIDSVTNFSCRLAKHRGGDTLEVKDLQLHLERNHNIRIPGFAADDTKISLSQSALAPSYVAPGGKKTAQGPHMTLRSQRLAQVQQAKREAKLM